MTSTTIPGFAQQDLEGRSVRDVVAYSPGEVDDAWCRKVLRKILKSLELQYAMQMPHRAITPDTVVFHANGEPLLISDDIDAAPAPDAHQAEDLAALAGVIHYAITHELAPAGPLAGRVDGYSAAVVATIDACMAPDPALRPRSIDAVRGLLDPMTPGGTLPDVPARPDPEPDATTVAAASLGAAALPPSVSPSPPVSIPAPAEPASAYPTAGAHPANTRRVRRWAIAGGGAIAAALALIVFSELRDAGPNERIVPTPPQTGDGVHQGLPAPAGAAPVDAVAADAPTGRAAIGAVDEAAGAPATPATPDRAGGTAKKVDRDLAAIPASDRAGSAGASSAGATQSGGDADQPDGTARAASSPASAAAPRNGKDAADKRATVPPEAASGNASYQLQIKPWGVVYVDGVERGVSPPVKRLALSPGPHTIRITNPKYRDSILEFESAQTTSNGKIIVDFTDEAR